RLSAGVGALAGRNTLARILLHRVGCRGGAIGRPAAAGQRQSQRQGQNGGADSVFPFHGQTSSLCAPQRASGDILSPLYHEAKRNGIIAHPEAVAGLAQPERRAVAQKQYNSRIAAIIPRKKRRCVTNWQQKNGHAGILAYPLNFWEKIWGI